MRIQLWLSALGLSVCLANTVHALDNDFWIDVKNNREQAVMRELALGLDPNSKSQEQQPIVMWAIQNQAWRVYDLLVAHRQFDPNVTNGHNETPLMYLAIMGEDQRARDLIARGAQVRRLGWTPLHYAASTGHLTMVQLLIDKGALVNSPAPDGTTPLMMAARSGNRPIVEVLLQQGADPTVRNLNQLTAADWAEANQQTRLAAQLRDLEQRYDHSQPTPLSLIDLTEPSTPETVDQDQSTAPSSPSTGGAQYFDLKRFE